MHKRLAASQAVVTPIDRAISSRLRTARERAGWSQERLAAVVQVDPTTLSKYEHARFPVPLAVLARAAAALGVALPRLVDVQRELPREVKPLEQQGRVIPPRGELAELVRAWEPLKPRDRRAIVAICRTLQRVRD